MPLIFRNSRPAGDANNLTASEVDGNFSHLNTNKADVIHSHNAADITGGTLGVVYLGTSGVRDATTYLAGDNTWKAIPAAGATTIAGISGLRAALDAKNTYTDQAIAARSLAVANVQNSSYTAVLADGGAVIEMDSTSANTFTVPTNASVAFPVGTVIEICQVNTGVTTIAAASGVTLRGATSLALRAQWSTATIRKRSTNEWVVVGDFA